MVSSFDKTFLKLEEGEFLDMCIDEKMVYLKTLTEKADATHELTEKALQCIRKGVLHYGMSQVLLDLNILNNNIICIGNDVIRQKMTEDEIQIIRAAIRELSIKLSKTRELLIYSV